MRHILHGLPCGTSTLSVFLSFPLGPIGQSGYAIPLIEQDINKTFTVYIIPECPFKFESIY